MNAKRLLSIGIALTFLVSIPASAQVDGQKQGINNPFQSTPTTLYMHIDGIQDFPINTQPPDDRYSKGVQFGLATASLTCGGDAPGASGAKNNYHTYYGYSSPGYVEYDFEEDGGPRYHKERGLSFDVILDGSTSPVVYWYMETQATSSDVEPDPNQVPIVIPQVVARAIIRSGDDVTVGDEGFNRGQVIAQGRTDPADLAADQTNSPQVTYYNVDGKHVYEFAIPLTFQNTVIDRDESYNIRVDTFIDNPQCNDPQYPSDEYVMSNNARVHTSPGHRPRVEWAVMNPIVIEYLHPQFIGDEMVIHTAANSPWGNYDVAETEGPYGIPGGIELSVEGPSVANSLYQAAFVQRHHEHNHHQEAVDVTYIWPYKQDGAQDGVYTVKFKVKNDQENAMATGNVQFQIGKGDLPACDPDTPVSERVDCVFVNQAEQVEESPGVGFVALVGMLGALVALRRRK